MPQPLNSSCANVVVWKAMCSLSTALLLIVMLIQLTYRMHATQTRNKLTQGHRAISYVSILPKKVLSPILTHTQSLGSAAPCAATSRPPAAEPPLAGSPTQADGHQHTGPPWLLLLRFALEFGFCAIHP